VKAVLVAPVSLTALDIVLPAFDRGLLMDEPWLNNHLSEVLFGAV
jgi:hypothetical protein